ncbi:MAG: peptidoglycan-binding protein, partial [Candidatus Fimadaptatus sp.]
MNKKALLLALALACASVSGGALAEPAGEDAPAAQVSMYQTMERGDKGEAVRALMQRLADLGYYTSSVDDSFGPGMAKAVRKFNAMCGLEGGETANAQTQERAFADD